MSSDPGQWRQPHALRNIHVTNTRLDLTRVVFWGTGAGGGGGGGHSSGDTLSGNASQPLPVCGERLGKNPPLVFSFDVEGLFLFLMTSRVSSVSDRPPEAAAGCGADLQGQDGLH